MLTRISSPDEVVVLLMLFNARTERSYDLFFVFVFLKQIGVRDVS